MAHDETPVAVVDVDRAPVLPIALWIAGAAIGFAAALAATNSLRFRRRVSREAREMWAGTAGPRPIERARVTIVVSSFSL